jgi:hypothetical protein
MCDVGIRDDDTGANKPDEHEIDFSDWLDDLPEKPTLPAQPNLTQAGAKAAPSTVPMPTAPRPAASKAAPTPIPHHSKTAHLPAFAMRSDLFGVSRPERFDPAKTYVRRECSSTGKYALACKGPLLSQRDKAVWLATIDIAKAKKADLNLAVDVPLVEIARRLYLKSEGGSSLDWINESLQRLVHCEVEATLEVGPPAFGRLIQSSFMAAERHRIVFDAPFLEAALSRDKQFEVNLARRADLPSNMVIWLHDYLSTHSKAEELDVGYLRVLSGYAGEQSRFARILANAMAEIVAATPKTLVASFQIAKGTRDSNLWKLKYVKGTDTASFVLPKQAAPHQNASAKKSHVNKPIKRSGGVVL